MHMKRDGRTLAHNTLEEMRVVAVQRMNEGSLLPTWRPRLACINPGLTNAVRLHAVAHMVSKHCARPKALGGSCIFSKGEIGGQRQQGGQRLSKRLKYGSRPKLYSFIRSL
jgi:hypothetical protein